MEIITRSEALAANLNKYFTGLPCKNGHIELRYTKSGGCQGCIAENNGRVISNDSQLSEAANTLRDAQIAYQKEKLNAIARSREIAKLEQAERLSTVREKRNLETSVDEMTKALRNAVTEQLMQMKVRLFTDDVEMFAASAYAFAVMRFPEVLKGDVYPGLLPLNTCAGTGLYKFNCHIDDVVPLRDLAADLIRSRPTDVVKRREDLINLYA